ncbi:chemotaxis protein CheW [Massilia cavernae]|uniref:Chemotaxis protein CheW n=2 Tax=Massilia cavernae TaxID=2320864 RepID=A0A418XW43_9BURK|nr:chemotaxis protein CheW [Massilia cavernae]
MAAVRALDTARASSGQVELFGSFLLAGEEFALPASSIREVVNFPERLIPVPLAPHFLDGVFTLRGHVIPVVNLARIFDAGAGAASSSDKIAIVEHEDIQVGIVFHSTGEVLRVRPEQRSMLQYAEGGAGGVVAGTILLDDGARLLQVLDAHALVHIENVPHVQALLAFNRGNVKSQFQLQAARRQCLSFLVGGTTFAFEISAIREIIAVPELKPSVMAGPLCLGRMNFRGHAVAVIDFAALLRLGSSVPTPGSAQRILVAMLGDSLIGMLVDSIDSIFHFSDNDVMPVPLLSKARAGMFTGCMARDEGGVLFLDHQGIFSASELVEISEGHTNLYQAEAQGDESGRALTLAKSRREVYIVFGLDTQWAVAIGELREIISYGAPMVKPPGLPPFVTGVLNLRQQVVSVIDLRCLFGLPPPPDLSSAKIMIIERGEERYGLLVDQVDTILTVMASQRRATPQAMAGNDGKRFPVAEVIEVTGPDGKEGAIAIFAPAAFIGLLDARLYDRPD